MNKRTVRLLLKLSAPANIALLLAVAWDYLENASRLMLPLLATYAAFLVAVLVLLFANPQGRPAEPKDPHPLDDERVAIAQRP